MRSHISIYVYPIYIYPYTYIPYYCLKLVGLQGRAGSPHRCSSEKVGRFVSMVREKKPPYCLIVSTKEMIIVLHRAVIRIKSRSMVVAKELLFDKNSKIYVYNNNNNNNVLIAVYSGNRIIKSHEGLRN